VTPQELDDRRRRFTSTVLEQVATDTQFRQQLIDDPKAALDGRGLWGEYNAILQGYQQSPETEGYLARPPEEPYPSSCGACGGWSNY
jgi:hypothetical protein